jgi:hypothetical protein
MGTASSDRARLRTDLRELAKLAGADSTPAPPHTLDSADSSGFIDLSAFSASDSAGDMDSWVERELARAGGRTKGGAVLTAGSMAPVAMASLLGEPEAVDADAVAGARKRGWVYTGLGLVGAAVVAVLAVALARHAPPSAKSAPQADVAAAAAQPAPGTPAAAPQDAPAAPTPVASASAAPIAVTVSAPDPTPTSKKHPPRWHGGSAAAAAPVAAAAAHPAPAPAKVTIPAPKSGGGGGDSLMDLMRASINAPKKLH